MSRQISELDHNGAQAILTVSEAVSSYNPLNWVIEKLQNLPIEEKKELDDQIPSPFDWIKNGVAAFGQYHGRVLKKTSHWSHEVKKVVNWTSTQILYPLSFCKIGRAIQHSLSYDILGSIAQSIAFCALQIFHLIPYIIVGFLTAGTVSLYQTNPDALAAILLGGMLTTNLWFIYRLVKTVDTTNKIFEQKADEFIAALNIFQFAKNTIWTGYDLGKRVIRWTFSWVPTEKKQPQPQQLPARIPVAE